VILSRIGDGKVDVNTGNWRCVSKEAKDLVLRMLDVDPARRPTASLVRQHPWMTSANPPTTQLLHENPSDTVRVSWVAPRKPLLSSHLLRTYVGSHVDWSCFAQQ
jgi:serine/threonine protein kinase